MRAKITAYNYNNTAEGCTDFSLNCYWGNDYKNVFYLCGDFGRSTFDDIIETQTDVTGQTERTQNTSIERFNLAVLATTPLLQFLKTIDKHDVKTIELIDTGAVYNIRNIDIDDQGEILTPNNLVYINFEDEPITKISSNVYTVDTQKLAYWDNNNDGLPNIDGDMEFFPLAPFFASFQLYFEADGITPAVAGDVTMLAYAETQTGTVNLIGIFRGVFGDSFDDSTKWQSTQNIWSYFDAASIVGHTNVVGFYKGYFAETNGYLSDETEDRAVKIRFDLSIDSGTSQSTTQQLVYTVRGGFSSSGIQDQTTFEYGITTLGKATPEEKNTLSTIQDIRINLGAGTSTLITSPVLSGTTAFSNIYVIDVAPTGEQSYTGQMATAGGYVSSNVRGSDTAPTPPVALARLDFKFCLDETAAIDQELNVLAFTSGASPYIITLDWEYLNNGVFNLMGDVVANSGEILLNGALVAAVPAINHPQISATGTQIITLPDTGVHTVKLTLTTTTAYEVYTEFELQLKPLY
jgi:hypothetical protein